MLQISELPRKDGIVAGEFFARHKSDSFSLEGYGFKFVRGVTEKPVLVRVHERLHAAYGGDVVFEPANEESAAAVLQWLQSRGAPEQRVLELASLFTARFGNEEEHRARNAATVASLRAQLATKESDPVAAPVEETTASAGAAAPSESVKGKKK